MVETVSFMEDIKIQEEEHMKEPLLTSSSSKGGFITMPFIIAHQGLETFASFGLEPNMIVYLMQGYGMEMALGTNVLNIWSAATNFTPILGAFVADSLVGRFRMILIGCAFSLLGMIMLFSTSIIPGTRPSCANLATDSCNATPLQLTLLFSTLALMSIGAGGVRSSNSAFGADQLSKTRAGFLEKYFTWGFFVFCISLLLSQTFVVYIQDHVGWEVGFGIPVLVMLFSAISLLLGSSLYVKLEPKGSLLTGFAQVVVASWRNRHYDLSSHNNTRRIAYHAAKESTVEMPSDNQRFLNKACVMKDPKHEDQTINEEAINPWRICTVDQVEEFKSIIKIIPFWTVVMLSCVIAAQPSFRMLQAKFMDRHLFSSNFEIPAGSFGNFAVLTSIVWLAFYDTVALPLASKVMGKPVHLKTETRLEMGLISTTLSMVLAAVVESIRRDMATRRNLQMSALWLVPQLCLAGVSGALIPIAANEYFYSELPSSMSSLAINLSRLSLSISSLVASMIVSLVDNVTSRKDQESWVSSDPNKGHYDYYYWCLTGLSLLNCIYFIVSNRVYGQARMTSSTH